MIKDWCVNMCQYMSSQTAPFPTILSKTNGISGNAGSNHYDLSIAILLYTD